MTEAMGELRIGSESDDEGKNNSKPADSANIISIKNNPEEEGEDEVHHPSESLNTGADDDDNLPENRNRE